jgi:hypothetical protein
MKAAREAWGADSNLFHQGAAKQSDDPEVVAATMAKPGVVLRRPVGSQRSFGEHSDLPSDLGSGENGAGRQRRRAKLVKRGAAKAAPELSEREARKAAADFDKEQKRREAERRREEAVREKERGRREKATAKAQAALDKAEREHEERASAIEAERAAVDERARAEEVRWEQQKEKLTAALRRARE